MNCYIHRATTALGICRACGKAVCEACARDTGAGLACSDPCAKEIEASQKVVEITRRAYGVGTGRRLPAAAIFFAFMGAVLVVNAGRPLIWGGEVGWMSMLMGGAFLVFAAYIYRRNRAIGLNG